MIRVCANQDGRDVKDVKGRRKGFLAALLLGVSLSALGLVSGCAGSASAAKSSTPVSVPPSGTNTTNVTSVTITPASASATTGGTVQFSATVQGTASNKTVSWKAAIGQVTSSGLYTAPASGGDDTVTSTSEADSTKSATAQVAVNAPTPTASIATSGALAAFPEAQGGGAGSAGGRGGAVIEVTNN